MDLLCYEEIEYNYLEETNECNICYELFFKFLNVKDVNLYAALPASIVFILRIIIIVQYAAIKLFDILI
jgi:hypothetical protein